MTAAVHIPTDAGPTTMTARAEWVRGWPVVLTGMIGVSLVGVVPYSLGQFMAPLEHAFGWSRTTVTVGIAAGVPLGVVVGPMVGRLVDRVDARRIVLPAILATALAIAGFSLAQASVGRWIALWMLYNVSVLFVGPTVWVAAIAGVFRQGRSLAMSLALSGAAFSSTLAPMVGRWLIDAAGWRQAFVLLPALWFGIAFLAALVLFVDHRPRVAHATGASAPPGTPMRAIVTTPAFVRLAAASFFSMSVVSATMIHLAPMLVDKGFAALSAARIAGVAGLALVGGKLAVGALFDRFPPGVMALAVLSSLALGCVLMATVPAQPVVAVAAVAALGASAGSMLALIACITGRLFRPADFGTAFGMLMSMVSLGGGIGPIGFSSIHDRFHSYVPGLWGALVLVAGCALLIGGLSGKAPDAPAGA